MTMLDSFLLGMNVILTVGILSFLYDENPLFRFAEYTVIGATTGNWLVMGLNAIRSGALVPLTQGQWQVIPGIVLGILYFARYFGKPWLNRYSIAFLTGTGVGLAVRAQGGVTLQTMSAIIQPLTMDIKGLGILVAALSVPFGLLYFIYTKEHKGILGGASKIGRYFIMFYMGQGFVGYMDFVNSNLVERLTFLVSLILGR